VDAERRTDASGRSSRITALFEAAHAGQPAERDAARRELVVSYLGMADAVAGRYRSRTQDWGDMRQVAYIGLIKAVDRYNPDRGDDFASFAVPTISGELKRHLRDNGWVVRPPRALQELHGSVVREIPRIAQALGHDPTNDEVAAALGQSRSRVNEAITCNRGMSPVSLDAPLHADNEGTTLSDTLRSADEELDRAELVQVLRGACRALTPRERRIVFLRFYRDQTQSEIASELGVTQMQVSRLLTKILGRLRDSLATDVAEAV